MTELFYSKHMSRELRSFSRLFVLFLSKKWTDFVYFSFTFLVTSVSQVNDLWNYALSILLWINIRLTILAIQLKALLRRSTVMPYYRWFHEHSPWKDFKARASRLLLETCRGSLLAHSAFTHLKGTLLCLVLISLKCVMCLIASFCVN